MFYYPNAIRMDAKYQALFKYPAAHWLCGKKPHMIYGHLRRFFKNHDQNTIVIYAITERDLNQYSAGGLDTTKYLNFIKNINTALCENLHRPDIIFEPDAIAHLSQCNDAVKRLDTISQSLEILQNHRVYLDIGHPRWHSVDYLKKLIPGEFLNIVHGFSINVSSYCSLNECNAYSQKIFDLFGKKTTVDTSRNGNPVWNGQWLNPARRLLGHVPMFNPTPYIDSYQWIKVPGTSDGKQGCHPRAGRFSINLARDLLNLN